MLPYRSDRYIFTPVLVAGCFYATAVLGQSFEATNPDGPAQRDEVSIGGKFKFGDATMTETFL